MCKKIAAYVGTYTNGDSKGIYKFILDTETGTISDLCLTAEIENPTYLCISSNNEYLYSVAKYENLGGVAAFSINSHTGNLTILNHQLSEGNPPCHVSLSKDNRYLLSANYHKGEISVYPINLDGSLNSASAAVRHEGSGPNKERQEKAHVHYASQTPDKRYICSVDLGMDKIAGYSFNDGKLLKSDNLTLSLKPGSGPRHMIFHPNNKFAYVLTELSSEVVTIKYNEIENSLKIIEYTSSILGNNNKENLGSAIHISPDGRFLYASNRGHDSIAAFLIDPDNGSLKFIEHTSTAGSGPRDFCIDPSGKYLIAANQNTNSLVPFLINKETGNLTQTSEAVSIPNPVCIKFLNL